MTTPRRIQRKRTRGWRMPEGAVYVGRPSPWGNPFPVDGPEQPWLALALGERADRPGRQRAAVKAFRWWIADDGTLPPIPKKGEGSGADRGELEYASGERVAVRDLPVGMGLMMLAKDSYQFGPAERPDLGPLRGKDLVCWCALCPDHAAGLPLGTGCASCAPCHADVLLELANR